MGDSQCIYAVKSYPPNSMIVNINTNYKYLVELKFIGI